ncbi:MAG TPA: hypothetical protein VGH67_21750 [Solirubrobacteraceae bacterium]|jgi:hypothetical protein
MAVFAVAATCPDGAVLDSTFYPYSVPLVRELPGAVVEVRCVCPREVAAARYRARSAASARAGAGDFDDVRTPEELWDDHLTPLGMGPVVEVDTSSAVSITAAARRVRDFSKHAGKI